MAAPLSKIGFYESFTNELQRDARFMAWVSYSVFLC